MKRLNLENRIKRKSSLGKGRTNGQEKQLLKLFIVEDHVKLSENSNVRFND
jgi:hypothetical protein